MAGKKTALERAQEKTQQRAEPSAPMDWRMLLFPVLMTLLSAASIWWLYQTGSHWWYERESTRLLAEVEELRTSLVNDFREKESQMLLAAESEQALLAAKDGSSGVLASAALDLRTRLTGVEWLRIFQPAVERLSPEPHPGLGWAGIYLLLRAKESGLPAGPGGGLVRTDNAHYSWAIPVTERVGDNNRQLLGFLLTRYPLQPLMDRVRQADVGGGYLDLRIYSQLGSGLVAASSGQLRATADLLDLKDVGDTEFKIAYHYPRLLLQNSFSWWLNLIAAGITVILLVWTVKQRAKLAAVGVRTEDSLEPVVLEDEEEVDEGLESAMAFASQAEGLPDAEPQPDAAEATEEESVREPVAVDADELPPASIFRTYDIRGIVGETLTADHAQLIGQSIGSEARARAQQQVVVARDGRLSSPEMSEALIVGLTRAGVDVIDIGAVPTGVLYFATHHLETGSGVMVTGSHNPPNYNGFKIMLGGDTLSGDAIRDLHRRLDENDLVAGDGGIQELDVLDEYVDRIASDVQMEEPLKVVVDCGNGIPGRVAPWVLEEIGAEVVPLYCDVDGEFPNHHPDPSEVKNLQDLIMTVERLDADLGVAFDGDGDRLGVVTRDGEVIFPDRLMMLFAEDVLTRNPGAVIIYDVKCTGHLAKVILAHGGSPIMWKTGHSLIKGKMKETQAALAGEMSGHFFFQERWYGFDDGIYACARLLEILASLPDGATAALEALPSSVSTPEIKVEMAEGEHYAFVEEFVEKAQFDGARITTIDGVRADYDDGWGLVRCSNTTPCLVMRFDAGSTEALARIQGAFREQLLAVKPDLELPF
ncbi:MAG: phosphomannomutase/phosphoglucomutase [Pseudomonadota bacterium]